MIWASQFVRYSQLCHFIGKAQKFRNYVLNWWHLELKNNFYVFPKSLNHLIASSAMNERPKEPVTLNQVFILICCFWNLRNSSFWALCEGHLRLHTAGQQRVITAVAKCSSGPMCPTDHNNAPTPWCAPKQSAHCSRASCPNVTAVKNALYSPAPPRRHHWPHSPLLWITSLRRAIAHREDSTTENHEPIRCYECVLLLLYIRS